MNEELLAALKEWHQACKIWDDALDQPIIAIRIPTRAEQDRCNDAAKRLRALAERL